MERPGTNHKKLKQTGMNQKHPNNKWNKEKSLLWAKNDIDIWKFNVFG